MSRPLDYEWPGNPPPVRAPNVCGRSACLIAVFLVGWFVWGAFKLLDEFYAAPGGGPVGPAHRTWWYLVYGVGTAVTLAGVLVGAWGLRASSGRNLSAVLGVIANTIALAVNGWALPYQD